MAFDEEALWSGGETQVAAVPDSAQPATSGFDEAALWSGGDNSVAQPSVKPQPQRLERAAAFGYSDAPPSNETEVATGFDEENLWKPNDAYTFQAYEDPKVFEQSQDSGDDGGSDQSAQVMAAPSQSDNRGIGGWFEDRGQDIGNWVEDIGDGFNVAGEGIQRVQEGDIGGGLAQVGGGLAEGVGTAIKPVNDVLMAPFMLMGRQGWQAYNAAKDIGQQGEDAGMKVSINPFDGTPLEGPTDTYIKYNPILGPAENFGRAVTTLAGTAFTPTIQGAMRGELVGPDIGAAQQQAQQAWTRAEGKGLGDYFDRQDREVEVPQGVPIIGGIKTTIPERTGLNMVGEIAPYFIPVFGEVGAAGKGLSALGGAGKVIGAPLQAYAKVGQAALEAPNRLVTAVAGGPKIGAALTAGAFTTYLGATAVPKVEKTDEDGNTQVLWDPSRIMGSDPSGIVLPLIVALGGAALWRGGGGATIAFDKALGAATGNALRGRVLTQITTNEKPVYVRDNGPAVDMGQGTSVPVPLEVVGVNRTKLPQGVRIAQPGEVIAKYSNIAQDRPITAATRSIQGVEQVIADLARVADNDPQAGGPLLRDFLADPKSTVLGGANTPDIQAARKLLNSTIDRYVDIEKNTVLGVQDARTDVINRLLLQNGGDGAQFGANLMQKATDQVVRQLGIKNADWETSNIRRFTALADQLFEDQTLAVRLGETLKRQGGDAAVLVKDSPQYRQLLGAFVNPDTAGGNRGAVERRVGQTLTRIEQAWKDVQKTGKNEGTVYRTPDALNPRLRGFGQNEWVDAMAMSKAIMSPYLLSGAPRYFINNLIGDSINIALSTQGRAFGTVTEAGMRQRLSNWGLASALDGEWASGGSIKNAMGKDIAAFRLPNQTGRVRAVEQFARDRAPRVMGAIDVATLNRPLRAFGERVQDMAVLGEAYRRRMAITAETLPIVERNMAQYVEQRARMNGATPEQARQLGRDVVQAVNTDGLGALKSGRFQPYGLDLDGIPREYQADIRRAWKESRGDPAAFQQRVNTLLDESLTTIKGTIDSSATTQASSLFGAIVDRTPYQAPTSARPGGNRVPGDTAGQALPQGGVRNARPGTPLDPAQSRISDLLAARNEPIIGSGQQRPGNARSANTPQVPNAVQIPVSGVRNTLTSLIPDDVIQQVRASASNSRTYTPAARTALSKFLQEVRAAEGKARGEYGAHAANVKAAAGETLSKYDRDVLSGRILDDGLDLEPRQVYRNAVAILQAESGLTKAGSTRKFFDLAAIDTIIRTGAPKRVAEAERFLRGYQSFLTEYDVLRLPKGKSRAAPVVTVRKGSVATPSSAAELAAYLDAAQRAADARQASLALANQGVGQSRISDIIGTRNDPDATATQGRPVTGEVTNQAGPQPTIEGQQPGVFRGTQPTPAEIRVGDTQPRTGADALALANQGLDDVLSRPGSKTVAPQMTVDPTAPITQASAKPVTTADPRASLDDVMARTMPSHLKMATAFDELTRSVMAVPDDLRLAPDFPDRVREAMNDPIYGGDPKIKAVADAIEQLDSARTTHQQAVDIAMREAGLNGKMLDPDLTRRILDDIPDPVNPGWKLADGTDYVGPAVSQGNQWLSRDGQPLTFTRSMAWAMDPVPDVVARIGDVHDAVRGKLRAAVANVVPTDARYIKASELQDALRLAQQMASRDGLSKSRAMMFGYDDRSQGQYLLDHWSPYSYWTVSHMLRTAQYLAPNPQAFAGMAIAIRQVAEKNKDQAPWDRFSVAFFTMPDGTTTRINPAQFFPYATQGVASLVSPDDESLAKNLLDLFGLSAHIPLNLALQWVTTKSPDNPYTTWYTGTKPGEKRARSLTPQTELVRLLSGGAIDIEGGKAFGVQVPSFRQAIYGADAPSSNATATTLELARRVFAGELTELDARRAILSWKNGAPNDVYRDAENQGLRDKGIGALVRFLGAPVTIKSAEANRIDDLYNQLGTIPKTDKKASAAFFDANPDLSVYSSAGAKTTAESLGRSIGIDEQPIYTGGTPEQQERWAAANKVFGDVYGAAIDAGKSTSVAAQEARAALQAAGYDYDSDFQLGNYYENPERKRLLAQAGEYAYTPARQRYSDQDAVRPEELVARDQAQALYYQNRDTMNARSREARVVAQFGREVWDTVKKTALKSDGTPSFGGNSGSGNGSGSGSYTPRQRYSDNPSAVEVQKRDQIRNEYYALRDQGVPAKDASAQMAGKYGADFQTAMDTYISLAQSRGQAPTRRTDRVDWDKDPVAKGIDGQDLTVRGFWEENRLLRERKQFNDANKQMAANWDALIAAGVKLTGEKPKYRSDVQEDAFQKRAVLLEAYGKLKDKNAQQASAFYSKNADEINRLSAIINGKPYNPSPFYPNDRNAPRGRSGGSIRVPRAPFTPRTSGTPFRAPVDPATSFKMDPDAGALRNYLSGKQGIPNEAYLRRLRLRYNFGVAPDAPLDTWMQKVREIMAPAMVAA